jgi:hypothetical protein
MKPEQVHTQILEPLEIDVRPEDLAARIKTSGNDQKIQELANKALTKVRGRWHPRAVIRWLGVDRVLDNDLIVRLQENGERARLRLGHASRFVEAAGQVLVGVYTAGDELELAAAAASRENQVMDSYFYDLIGLAVLEKTQQYVNGVVEKKARELNWGVGPFLSPGSVHGWELTDQPNLLALVPIDTIGVQQTESGILAPYKTIACLIGIGPGYEEKTVGSACAVCSQNKNCEMHQKDSNKR